MRPDPKFARRVSLAWNEVAQLRREALRLKHLARDQRRGLPAAHLANQLETVAETLTYLLARAEARGATAIH